MKITADQANTLSLADVKAMIAQQIPGAFDAKKEAKKPAAKAPAAPKKTVATHTNKTAARAKGVTKGDR